MLGLKLCGVLRRRGFYVIGSYHNDTGLLRDVDIFKKIRFDITSEKSVEKLKKVFIRLDAIIHCAAMTEVNLCERNKKRCFAANVIGTKHVVDLASHFNAKLIYISTPMVFSGIRGNYTEQSRPKPLNYYSRTKLFGEREALKYNRSLVLRVNPIGIRPPGAHPSFIQWFAWVVKKNQSFNLFSDVFINPLSTSTLSGVIAKLIKDFRPGTLHLGSRDVVNKADIWKIVAARFPHFSGIVTESSVHITAAGKIARRPTKMWLSVKKAARLGMPCPLWRIEVIKVLQELGL